MTTVSVSLSKSYDVLIGDGLLGQAGALLAALCASRRAAVVTDDTVGPRYAGRLVKSLENEGFDAPVFTVHHGEGSKDAAHFIGVLNWLAGLRLTRGDTVVALGGGVVGDLAGFAAAAYLRGVRLIQVPTTLLAAVDSSVGGKTAINLEAGKNLAGAFHQPSLVICDCDTLETLPGSVLSDGLSEVVKYGVIGSERLFGHIADRGADFDRAYVISECVKMKRDIVSKDEFDTGPRQLLNFGHTAGHAIETCSGYAVTHGSAVAVGMAIVTRAAAKAGLCPKDCPERLEAVLKRLDLPTESPFGADALYGAVRSDKKVSGGVITVVVPEKIGSCVLKKFSLPDFKEFLKAGI